MPKSSSLSAMKDCVGKKKRSLEISSQGLGIGSDWGLRIPRSVIPSVALDLYYTAIISTYALSRNDVLVLFHIRQ